jgi:predicted  nucleic acid-binding Zn-ribbon protein
MTGSKGQPANKKHLRRIRAELINEKSRTLRALQTKIDETEKEIMGLEEKTGQDNSDLLKASVTGDGETIKKLSKAVHDSKSKIESLFSELELLHIDLENRTKEFEEKIGAAEI